MDKQSPQPTRQRSVQEELVLLAEIALDGCREITNPADEERQIRDTHLIAKAIFASWLGLDLLNSQIADQEGRRNMERLAERVGPAVMAEAQRQVEMKKPPAMPKACEFKQLELGW